MMTVVLLGKAMADDDVPPLFLLAPSPLFLVVVPVYYDRPKRSYRWMLLLLTMLMTMTMTMTMTMMTMTTVISVLGTWPFWAIDGME
jgi:drug/metabolite transporter (DMT)-like permease